MSETSSLSLSCCLCCIHLLAGAVPADVSSLAAPMAGLGGGGAIHPELSAHSLLATCQLGALPLQVAHSAAVVAGLL